MVRKVVFPVAGLGTRMLPVTKEIPKEMLPVIDKPLIQYAAEEALASGFEEFIFITSGGKETIQKHFAPNSGLEELLRKRGKEALLADIRLFYEKKFIFLQQHRAEGFGHAVLLAEDAVGNEPFAVILPDDLITADVPVLAQMAALYERYRSPLIAFMKVPEAETSRYGIAAGPMIADNLFAIRELVEKPPSSRAPSNYAVIGRYILTPDIFPLLRKTGNGAGAEIQLTDALIELARTRQVLGYFFSGRRFDAGTPAGYVETVIHAALARADTRDAVRSMLQDVLKDETP